MTARLGPKAIKRLCKRLLHDALVRELNTATNENYGLAWCSVLLDGGNAPLELADMVEFMYGVKVDEGDPK